MAVSKLAVGVYILSIALIVGGAAILLIHTQLIRGSIDKVCVSLSL